MLRTTAENRIVCLGERAAGKTCPGGQSDQTDATKKIDAYFLAALQGADPNTTVETRNIVLSPRWTGFAQRFRPILHRWRSGCISSAGSVRRHALDPADKAGGCRLSDHGFLARRDKVYDLLRRDLLHPDQQPDHCLYSQRQDFQGYRLDRDHPPVTLDDSVTCSRQGW